MKVLEFTYFSCQVFPCYAFIEFLSYSGSFITLWIKCGTVRLELQKTQSLVFQPHRFKTANDSLKQNSPVRLCQDVSAGLCRAFVTTNKHRFKAILLSPLLQVKWRWHPWFRLGRRVSFIRVWVHGVQTGQPLFGSAWAGTVLGAAAVKQHFLRSGIWVPLCEIRLHQQASCFSSILSCSTGSAGNASHCGTWGLLAAHSRLFY